MTISLHVQCARELAALRAQVHALNNQLTAVTLERDALDRKCAALALLHYGPKAERATTGG